MKRSSRWFVPVRSVIRYKEESSCPTTKNIFDPNTLSDRVVRLAHLNFTLNEFTNLLQLLGVEYEESSYYLEDSVLQKVVHIHTGIGKVEMAFDTEHGFLRYTIIRHIPIMDMMSR